MRIIPSIELVGGKCIKPGSGLTAPFAHDPTTLARELEEAGLRNLHLVDLEGARQGRALHWRILENILRETELLIDFSGGIRTLAEVEQAIDLGAIEVGVGSIALAKPKLFHEWFEIVGADRLVLCLDLRSEKVAGAGGGMHWAEMLKTHSEAGLVNVMVTDLDHFENHNGPNFNLLDDIRQEFPELTIIANGGVQDAEDVHQLGEIGMDGTVVGKALNSGSITIETLCDLQNEWD